MGAFSSKFHDHSYTANRQHIFTSMSSNPPAGLPADVWNIILSYNVSPKFLLTSIGRVSKLLFYLSVDDAFWKPIFARTMLNRTPTEVARLRTFSQNYHGPLLFVDLQKRRIQLAKQQGTKNNNIRDSHYPSGEGTMTLTSIRYDFFCPMRWEDLTRTPDLDELNCRECPVCQKKCMKIETQKDEELYLKRNNLGAKGQQKQWCGFVEGRGEVIVDTW
eukprot:PhF_6_TR1553/c0_g1_i1/m.2830